jgi:hypothetical protein
LGGALQKGSQLLGNFNIDGVKKAVGSINTSAIFPAAKNFAQGLLGGALKPGKIDVAGVANKILNSNLVSVGVENLSGAISGKAKQIVGEKIQQIKNSVINPAVKGFSQGILGGAITSQTINKSLVKAATNKIQGQASLINKSLGNITKTLGKNLSNNSLGKSVRGFFSK